MSSEFSREIRKLEIRLQEYTKAEQEFVENVQECTRTLRELMESSEKRGKPLTPDEIQKLSRLKSDAINSLSQVLKSESNVEHEKSHILDSYAALVLCLENEFANLSHDSI